ncbi:hypothetical protein BUALT_Bualt03G0197800 [Buddleja alternifolia]|uniref:Uncharacterized protein n=1 Tax=Buddleja alternifolia TaxID=168488 RepID=A0AAV6XW31_9LAMI|nr:hypothetical protein BUALT_Bualt03G0197800 [Buddleja alternifolia]
MIMSMTLSTLHSKTPIKFPRIQQHNLHFLPFITSSSLPTTAAKPLHKLHNFYGPFKKTLSGFSVKSSSGFIVKAQNEGDFVNKTEEEEMEEDVRGQSSMPERFRYLSKEAPDKPVRWPWLIALAFGLYAWRTVLWELSNWKKAVGAVFQFCGYVSKFVLALIFRFIGDPITSLIRGVETIIYTIRAFYSGIINYAPIPDLTLIIMLTSAVLAISEATVPDSVNSQPYLLTVAGLIGFAAVKNYISETFFWILLAGLFGFAKFVKKRDYVSSALPVAAVLAGVGEPWVRVIVMASYLALAIFHRWINVKEDEDGVAIKKVPVPLICAALAIGIRVAAKWVGYRHLTWMIV